MARSELIGRGQQVGIVVAAGVVPTTLTRSLSERTWKDQGLITGLATGTHFLLTVMAQDLIDTAGTAMSTVLPFPESWSLERRQQAATLLLDVAAVPVGFGVVANIGTRDHEPTVRSVARQAGSRFGLTGFGATVLAASLAVQRGLDTRLGADGRIERFPIGIPVGLATAAVIERIRQRDTPPEHDADPARSNPALGLAAGAGVILATSGLTIGESWLARQLGSVGSRALPGSETTWRRAGHLLSLGAVVVGTHTAWSRGMRGIEAGTSKFDEGVDESAPGLWTGPTVSGDPSSPAGTSKFDEGVDESAPGLWTGPTVSGDPSSLVAWDTMGREGRRHVVSIVRPEPLVGKPVEVMGKVRPDLSISTVMQEKGNATPIAIFVGLDSAPTATERVDLALADMDRTDAWSRSLIALISPTGTGYVNYVATSCLHYLTRGDVATVTLQYSTRPSPLSLGKIGQAKEQNRLLWLQILERIRLMPPDARPRVVVFGESLGARTSQAPFQGWGTLGPEALGIDRALWIGTPASSGWENEVTGPPKVGAKPELVAVVNDYEQFVALGDLARRRVRFVLLSHDNDGVTKFNSDLLTRRPQWLGPERPVEEEIPGRLPRGIPASMRWRPVTTCFQSLVDMKNEQIPDAYKAWAHDYRPDLPDFIRDVFELDCTDDQLARIKEACEQREEFRQAVFS